MQPSIFNLLNHTRYKIVTVAESVFTSLSHIALSPSNPSRNQKESTAIGFFFSEKERGTMDDMTGSSGSMMMENTAATTTKSAVAASFFTNYPLFSALIAFAIAQSIKFFTSWYKEKRWDFKQLIGSGGMPSSHSATVTALAVAVGFHDGLGGSTFATALTLACVVMYDAFGVRLHAGRQAEVLNQIIYELPAEHPLAESRPLRELLGHTPSQVIAGAVLGIVTATIGHLIVGSSSNQA